jgi:hypothetical protein
MNKGIAALGCLAAVGISAPPTLVAAQPNAAVVTTQCYASLPDGRILAVVSAHDSAACGRAAVVCLHGRAYGGVNFVTDGVEFALDGSVKVCHDLGRPPQSSPPKPPPQPAR